MTTVGKERAAQTKEQSEQYFARFFALCDDFLEIMPEHKYARDFVGMMGSVYFARKRFDKLLEKFAGYENGKMNPRKGYVNKKEFLNSPAMPTAHYMSGLALLASESSMKPNRFLAPSSGSIWKECLWRKGR